MFVIKSPALSLVSPLTFLNSSQLDGVTGYVDWAAKNEFGIIDINVPLYLTDDSSVDMTAHATQLSDQDLEAKLNYLMSYMWDNYLQLHDDDVDLFFVGVGRAHLGIRALLLNRGGSKIYILRSSYGRWIVCSNPAHRLPVQSQRHRQLRDGNTISCQIRHGPRV